MRLRKWLVSGRGRSEAEISQGRALPAQQSYLFIWKGTRVSALKDIRTLLVP